MRANVWVEQVVEALEREEDADGLPRPHRQQLRPGATPWYFPPERAPEPPMVLAQCVPWPLVKSLLGTSTSTTARVSAARAWGLEYVAAHALCALSEDFTTDSSPWSAADWDKV